LLADYTRLSVSAEVVSGNAGVDRDAAVNGTSGNVAALKEKRSVKDGGEIDEWDAGAGAVRMPRSIRVHSRRIDRSSSLDAGDSRLSQDFDHVLFFTRPAA
jgi:hypothetical protein